MERVSLKNNTVIGQNEPRPDLPCKIIFQPMINCDPLRLAENEINDMLALQPNKFNVLQIIDPNESIDNSYVKVSDNNTIYGEECALFDTHVIQQRRVLFDNVDSFVVMGGRAVSDLKWIVGSLIFIKGHQLDKNVYTIFESLKGQYASGIYKDKPPISSLKLQNKDEVNIHLNISAMYPGLGEISYISTFQGKEERISFITWNDVQQYASKKGYEAFRGDVHGVFYRLLPTYNRKLLSAVGLNVFEYFNGIGHKYSTSFYKDNPFMINLYYWSSTKEFSKFLILH